MIVGLKNAILHILDANSGVNVYSDETLDIEDAEINTFITKHIEKIHEAEILRPAEFKESSGFKGMLSMYKSQSISFIELSKTIASRMENAVKSTEEPKSCDCIVAEYSCDEDSFIAVLKCDNKVGITHNVVQANGTVMNKIINHYAILPSVSQRIAESAFIRMSDFEVRYASKKYKVEGETTDLFADLILECEFGYSTRECANSVKRIVRKVAIENGADTVDAMARMKEYVTEHIKNNEFDYVDTNAVAEKVFAGRPSVKEEFVGRMEKAGVPQMVEVNKYITKKMTANVKLSTDIGVELSFPPEYYKNPDYIEIITNEDGTISIKINNITELTDR